MSEKSLSLVSRGAPIEECAIYPLTVFDKLFTAGIMILGWVVEGHASPSKLEQAVSSVVSKWPMLGGRLEKTKRGYQLRIPLGGFPNGYQAYVVTTSVASEPFSHFVKLPLPVASDTLPTLLMKHTSTPTGVGEWMEKDLPPLVWHVTHLSEGDQAYSVIGLTFPHLIFDGLGISAIIHAVEAELQGKPWPVPELPVPGPNTNALESAISKSIKIREGTEGKSPESSDSCVEVVGIWFMITFLFWNFWQKVWHKSKRMAFVLPANALAKLVDENRFVSPDDHDVKITKGDILAAFIYKTAYSEGVYKSAKVHLLNFASLRRFFDNDIKAYPHNCVIPLPYPDMTVQQLNEISIPSLAKILAQCRSDFTEDAAIRCYNQMSEADRAGKGYLPLSTTATENIGISNMCIANIVNIDWSGTGAGRTIIRHKTGSVPLGIEITNVIIIVGYLDDGSLVFDVHLPRKRLDILEKKMTQLIEGAANYKEVPV